jgi:hypothetical protein
MFPKIMVYVNNILIVKYSERGFKSSINNQPLESVVSTKIVPIAYQIIIQSQLNLGTLTMNK